MNKNIFYLLLIIITISAEAISEAMYDEKLKMWSKLVQLGMIVSYWALIYLKKFNWWMPLIWLELRILFFGMIYNVVRGLPYNYIGTTDFYDIYIAKYLMIAPVWGLILYFTIISILKFIPKKL